MSAFHRSKGRSLRTALLGVVVSASLLAAGSPAHAEEDAALDAAAVSDVQSGEALAPDDGEALSEAAAELESFVEVNADGTFALGVPETSAPVAPEEYDALVAGMAEINEMIASGELVGTEDLEVYPAEVQAYGMESTGSKVYFHWWGVEVHLSAYATNKVINAASVAGAAAALCATTGWCAPAAAVFAGAVAIAAGIVGFCSNSRGVVIKRSWGPIWCHGH